MFASRGVHVLSIEAPPWLYVIFLYLEQKYFSEYCCTVPVKEEGFKKICLMFPVAKEMLCCGPGAGTRRSEEEEERGATAASPQTDCRFGLLKRHVTWTHHDFLYRRSNINKLWFTHLNLIFVSLLIQNKLSTRLKHLILYSQNENIT